MAETREVGGIGASGSFNAADVQPRSSYLDGSLISCQSYEDGIRVAKIESTATQRNGRTGRFFNEG